ncbi:MAG TPA: NDP-sugar synthase [Candidatus Thermoplasmatota archaeon]|nr:NDP-sugar synthase [Candidatus Thermoplasmatota archaeon]
MDAILLAGGYGTRLRPLTYTHPKPLLPVAGRPLVEWALDRLPQEVDRVIVCVNWLADALRVHFAASNRDIEFVVVQEDEPLGTAGAVKNAEPHIRSKDFFVLNADIISDMDLAALIRQHEATGAAGTISLKEVQPHEVVDFGVVRPDTGPEAQPKSAGPDTKDAVRIAGFVEKPARPEDAPSRFINAGAYLLHRDVLKLIPKGRLVSMEKEIFPHLIPQGFWGCTFRGQWIDVGDPTRLLQASRKLDPERHFGPGSEVAADARILDSVGGRGCRIGAAAILERCVLGDDVTVAAGVHLVDCIVGDGEHVSRDAKGDRIWSKPVPDGYPQKQVGNAKPAV